MTRFQTKVGGFFRTEAEARCSAELAISNLPKTQRRPRAIWFTPEWLVGEMAGGTMERPHARPYHHTVYVSAMQGSRGLLGIVDVIV